MDTKPLIAISLLVLATVILLWLRTKEGFTSATGMFDSILNTLGFLDTRVSEVDALKTNVDQLASQNAALQQRYENLSSTIPGLQSSVQGVVSTQALYAEQLEKLPTVESQMQEFASSQAALLQQLEEVAGSNSTLAQQQAAIQTSVNDLMADRVRKADLAAIQTSIADVVNKQNQMVKDLASGIATVQEVAKEITAVTAKQTTILATVEEAATQQELQAAIQSFQYANSQLRDRIMKLEADWAAADIPALAGIGDRVGGLENTTNLHGVRLDNMDAKITQLPTDIINLDKKIQDVDNKYIHLPARYDFLQTMYEAQETRDLDTRNRLDSLINTHGTDINALKKTMSAYEETALNYTTDIDALRAADQQMAEQMLADHQELGRKITLVSQSETNQSQDIIDLQNAFNNLLVRLGDFSEVNLPPPTTEVAGIPITFKIGSRGTGGSSGGDTIVGALNYTITAKGGKPGLVNSEYLVEASSGLISLNPSSDMVVYMFPGGRGQPSVNGQAGGGGGSLNKSDAPAIPTSGSGGNSVLPNFTSDILQKMRTILKSKAYNLGDAGLGNTSNRYEDSEGGIASTHAGAGGGGAALIGGNGGDGYIGGGAGGSVAMNKNQPGGRGGIGLVVISENDGERNVVYNSGTTYTTSADARSLEIWLIGGGGGSSPVAPGESSGGGNAGGMVYVRFN